MATPYQTTKFNILPKVIRGDEIQFVSEKEWLVFAKGVAWRSNKLVPFCGIGWLIMFACMGVVWAFACHS